MHDPLVAASGLVAGHPSGARAHTLRGTGRGGCLLWLQQVAPRAWPGYRSGMTSLLARLLPVAVRRAVIVNAGQSATAGGPLAGVLPGPDVPCSLDYRVLLEHA